MDDLEMIRFAIGNLPAETGDAAKAAFERILNGEAIVDPDSDDGRRYKALRRDVAEGEG